MIAMEVIGILLLPVFLVYSWKFAKYPVVPKRFLQNKTVVLAALIGAFDFVSFYLSFTYLYSFVVIVKPWPLLHANYFIQSQTVTLTVFAIVAGIILRFFRRYKVRPLFGPFPCCCRDRISHNGCSTSLSPVSASVSLVPAS
jgi:hypothetical protein